MKGKALILLAGLCLLLAAQVGLASLLFRTMEDNAARHESLNLRERDLLFGIQHAQDLQHDVRVDLGQEERVATLAHWQGHLNGLYDSVVRLGLSGVDLSALAAERRMAQQAVESGKVSLDDLVEFSEAIEHLARRFEPVLVQQLSQMQDSHHAVDDEGERLLRLYLAGMVLVAVLGLTGIGVAGATFFGRALAALGRLQQVTGRLAAGDFSVRLSEDRRDELGRVAEAVNLMAAGLAAREQELSGMRASLNQQERMAAMGVFAAQMAHELGNPIQAIMALSLHTSESLREDLSAKNVLSCVDNLDLIAEHAHRLSGTVQDIREFARPERLEREPVDLNGLVANSVRLMRFEPRFRTANVEVDLAPDLPPVEAVADHLVQVLVNLMINAADAIAKDGTVRVSTSAEPDGVLIRVADDGYGMEDAVRALVFDPFFTTKLGSNGTGLGLTICKRIVEDHGGRISIDSAVGCGTTVSVLLPKG